MQRWTTSYRFKWTPIVTFARRQLSLLDWIEGHLEPVAFYDREGTTGVAILSRETRLTVNRSGLTLEDGAVAGAGVGVLADAVQGVLDILQPKDVTLESGSIAWSQGLDGHPYNEARATLARTMSGIDMGADAPIPVDVSGLMDVLSPAYRGQVEWGVVSGEELVDRLSEPPLGRIATNRPPAAALALEVGEFPEASVFVDTTFWPLDPEHVDSATAVNEAIAKIDEESQRTARALYSRVSRSLEG